MAKNINLISKILSVLFFIFQFTNPFFSIHANENITVIDGDSFLIGQNEWRLWGVDAPELYQQCTLKRNNSLIDCGEDAKNKLISLMIKPINCQFKGEDNYKRKLGICKNADGKIINAEMVKTGFAFDYRRFSNFYFDNEEQEAKKNQSGLWQYQFLWPWHWRRENPRN